MLRDLRKVKLRNQLMLLIAVSIVFILTIEVYYYVSISSTIQRRANVYAENTLNQLVEKTETTNREVRKAIETLSFNKYTQLYLAAGTAEEKFPYSEILSETFPYFAMSNEQIDSVSLIDLQGVKAADHSIPLSLLDYIERNYKLYDKRTNTDVFTNIIKDPLSGNFYYAYVKSVYWSQENTSPFDKIGTCIVQISTDQLAGMLKGLSTTQNSEFLILDASNHIVASNKTSDKTGMPAGKDLAAVINGPPGLIHDRVDREDSLLQAKPIADTGWKVVSIIPVREINDDLKPVRETGILLVLLFSVLSIALGVLFNRNITRPISTLIQFLNRYDFRKQDRRLRSYENNEIGELYVHINNMLDENRAMTDKMIAAQSSLYEMELSKRQAELSALISQINPHFLYNTLDSLKGIGYYYNSEEIVNITECLSDILRYSIKGAETVRVREELACVRNYLTIIAIRFGDRFAFEWDIDDGIAELSMSKFILQPVVENAIYHGLEPKLGEGRLTIRGFLSEGKLVFEIRDNGMGIQSDELANIRAKLAMPAEQGPLGFDNRGIGLLNIHHRIRLLHKGGCGIAIDSAAKEGTTVRIELPVFKPDVRNGESAETGVPD